MFYIPPSCDAMDTFSNSIKIFAGRAPATGLTLAPIDKSILKSMADKQHCNIKL